MYVATQMHILPGEKCREEEAVCCHSGLFVEGRIRSPYMHATVTSLGLNESSLCVSYLKEERKKGRRKEKREEEIHSPPSELPLLALQLCLRGA